MTDPTQTPPAPKPQSEAKEVKPGELDDQTLEGVSGGVRGGDDDLDDLEVERARRR
jgi:hypothetical protein